MSIKTLIKIASLKCRKYHKTCLRALEVNVATIINCSLIEFGEVLL